MEMVYVSDGTRGGGQCTKRQVYPLFWNRTIVISEDEVLMFQKEGR